MGLAERRAVEQFKTEIYPRLKSEVDEAAGFDVNWNSLAADDYSCTMRALKRSTSGP